MRQQAPEPQLEFLATASVSVDPIQDLGQTPFGHRRIIPIRGGRFEGRIGAEVLPGGADWQIVDPDGVQYLEARYTIRTDDGALISVRNTGIRHGPPEVMARMMDGDPVDPSEYYFRSTPRFETADSRYSWLNRIVAICMGQRTPDRTTLDFYEVL